MHKLGLVLRTLCWILVWFRWINILLIHIHNCDQHSMTQHSQYNELFNYLNQQFFDIIQYMQYIDHGNLVYKVDSLVQSSLSSSLVLTLIQDFFLWSILRLLNCNTLASVDILYLCISWWSYLERGSYQEVEYKGSQTSKHEHLE